MNLRHPSPSKRQRGLTLIELMMALFVLAVGLAGAMILISTAIAGNNRNKLDTTSTLLSQMVIEKILAPGNTNLPPPPPAMTPPHYVTITDCTGNTSQIWLDPGPQSWGAAPPLTTTGDVDFTVPPPAVGYSMLYTVCKAAGQTAVYDVRWVIVPVKYTGPCPASPCTIYTKQVIAAARPTGAGTNSKQKIFFFGLPITLRGVSGMSFN